MKELKARVDNKNPLISVIMPNYCQGQYIGEAIQSVLLQTYQKLELIIIDNYSTDDTVAVVESFTDPRIRFFQFHNQGVIARSRNYGVQLARGEVIAFLDSDDIWNLDKLAIQIPLLYQSEVAAVTSTFDPIGEVQYASDYIHGKNKLAGLYQRFSFQDLIEKNRVITSSLMMQKKYFDDLQGFDESEVFAFYEDWELWLRVVHAWGDVVCYTAKPLVQYRIGKKKNRDQRRVALVSLTIAKKLLDQKVLTLQQYNTLCERHYFSIGMAHLEVGDRGARHYFLQSLQKSAKWQDRCKACLGLVLSIFPKSWITRLLPQLYNGRYMLRKIC
mgnify:CR=1 FL=1